MNRVWPVLTVLLIAAVSPDEHRLWRIAQAAFEDKLYEVAERQLSDFIQKFPSSERADNAFYLRGQALLHLDEWDRAAAVFLEAAARWPDKRPDSIQFWLGEAYSRGGLWSNAEARYAEVVEKHPKSSHFIASLFGLAFVQLKQGRLGPASDTLDRIAKIGPKSDLALEAELLRGQLFLARGDFAGAEAAFEMVIQKGGTTRTAYRAQYWLGESLAHRQQYTNALARYAIVTDAFSARPGKPVDAQLGAEAWFAAGWAHWHLGRFGDAGDAFQKALTHAVTVGLRRDALMKLAEAHARHNQIAEGIARLREFLQTRPRDPMADEVQLAIGDLYYQSGDYRAALAEYRLALANYPESSQRSRALIQAGWAAWQSQQFSECLQHFEAVLPLLTDVPDTAAVVLTKIADAQTALGQYTNAVATYERVVREHGNRAGADQAWFQLGELHRQLGNSHAALAAFTTLVADHPGSPLAPQAQYSIGELLAAAGNLDAARRAFQLVGEKFPASPWAANAALAVGESYLRENQFDRALAEFDKLTANGVDSELAQQALYSRGWTLARTGQRDKTLAEFLDFLKNHPHAPLAPLFQYWVADEYLRQRDYLNAQAQFQALAETYPTSPQADVALYFAGRAAFARQDFKAAVELYESLVRKFPQSSWRCDARFGQGDALAELGQHDGALLVFDALLKEFPDCSLACAAQGRRGDALFTLGRYDDAAAAYRKTADCAADPDLRHQALFKLGKTYETLKKTAEAFQLYAQTLYEATAAAPTNQPPERFWACKAGRDAALLKEQANDWRAAITLYEKLATACPDLKELAEVRVRQLRTQHPETLLPR